MKKVTLETIFNIEKGTLQSSKNREGAFHFITASSDWKTHDTYTYDCEAIVVAVSASGSLGRVHYIKDKFVASDLCFVLTVKNDYVGKVNLLYYYYLLSGQHDELVSLAKGAAKKSINKKDFSNYEVVFPEIENQNKLSEKLLKTKGLISKFYLHTTTARRDLEDLYSLIRNKISNPTFQKTTPLSISSFISRNTNTVTVDDNKVYRRLTIRMHAKGVMERDVLIGSKIGTKRQYLVSAGQLVISKIDARQGAFGIVPLDCDGNITTADFLSFNIDKNIISPDVLNELLQSKSFTELFIKSSQGATNRKRFNEKIFLAQVVQLPTQVEQQKMVKKFSLMKKLKDKLLATEYTADVFNQRQLQTMQT